MDWAIVLAVLFTLLFYSPIAYVQVLLSRRYDRPARVDELRRLRHDLNVWRKRYYRLREAVSCSATES